MVIPSVDVTRSGPTFIVFHVLEFTFDQKGALTMKLGSDLSKVKVKYFEEVDLGDIGVHVARHINNDKRSPHTQETDVLYQQILICTYVKYMYTHQSNYHWYNSALKSSSLKIHTV